MTGSKILFVNEVFTTSIVGMKTEESAYLLKFLFDYIKNAQDCHARVRWEGE